MLSRLIALKSMTLGRRMMPIFAKGQAAREVSAVEVVEVYAQVNSSQRVVRWAIKDNFNTKIT